MEPRLGLSPREMINIFNGCYLEVWEKTKDNVDWQPARVSEAIKEGKEVDLTALLVRALEVAVTACRDAAILTMHYNNEKIVDDLRRLGIEIPEPQPASAGDGEVDEA